MPEYGFYSDHRLLVTSMKTPKDKKSRWRVREKPIKKPNAKLLCDSAYKEFYTKQISDSVHNNESNHNSACEISDHLINTLSTAASNILPEKSPHKVKEIWKNDIKLNQLIQDRNEKQKHSMEYVTLTKKIKQRVRTLQNEKARNEAQELNSFSSRREIERMYKSFKSDGATFNPIKQKVGCDEHKLKEYFSLHFQIPKNDPDPIELCDAPTFLHQLRNVPVDFNTLPPNKNEIIATLKNLKNGKASSDIPAEYLKYAIDSNDVINELQQLYNVVWQTNKIPTNWTHSKLITIWKGAGKGKKEDPSAYRGIQVGSVFCKLLVMMILERTRNWYESQLLDNQQGFRSGRGTTDAIYIVKRIQQISHITKKPTYLLFVDLSAAFDHVNRKWLFKSLKQRFPNEGSNTLIKLLESIYSYTTTSLKGLEDNLFEIFVGVRQGGAESPTLYNLYMDYVMRVFMNECRSKKIKFSEFQFTIPRSATKNNKFNLGNYGKHEVSWIGYADDIVLAFKSIKDLNEGLKVLNDTFKRYQLNINSSKTKTMIFTYPNDDDEYPKTICKLEGSDIDNVMVFKYLGTNIHFREYTTGDAEIGQRIESAEWKFYEHVRKFMNFKIALSTRVSILNAVVRSRLTYGCQTWTINTEQKTRLNSFYVGLLRKMIRGGYKRKEDRMAFVYTNEEIIGISKSVKIDGYIEKMQQSFISHIIRREDNAIVKKLTFNSEPSRRQGRHTTLHDEVLSRIRLPPHEFYAKSITRVI